jgi:hypothetical protein
MLSTHHECEAPKVASIGDRFKDEVHHFSRESVEHHELC